MCFVNLVVLIGSVAGMRINVDTITKSRFLTALLAFGAVVVGIIAAPTALASPDKTRCSERSGASLCQRPGHSSLHSEPAGPNLSIQGNGGLFSPSHQPGFGRGMVPAIVD